MMVALASVLNFIILFTLPQGGAVTLGGMVPILFLALRRGVKVGIVAGMLLSLVILSVPGQAFVVNPIQFLLDYPLAFGALGLAGFFPKKPLIGVGVGIFGRFCSHFISGALFFASFAPAGESPILYSAIYNGSYLGVEFVVSTIVMILIMQRNLLKVNL
jgi:thiamine transporter